MCQHIEDKYISFGRILKLENRGYEHIGAGNGRLNIGQNTSKSDQYKAIRYVTHFPVGSETGKDRYSTILEIRVLQLDDLAKERSKHNHASTNLMFKEERLNVLSQLFHLNYILNFMML